MSRDIIIVESGFLRCKIKLIEKKFILKLYRQIYIINSHHELVLLGQANIKIDLCCVKRTCKNFLVTKNDYFFKFHDTRYQNLIVFQKPLI